MNSQARTSAVTRYASYIERPFRAFSAYSSLSMPDGSKRFQTGHRKDISLYQELSAWYITLTTHGWEGGKGGRAGENSSLAWFEGSGFDFAYRWGEERGGGGGE